MCADMLLSALLGIRARCNMMLDTDTQHDDHQAIMNAISEPRDTYQEPRGQSIPRDTVPRTGVRIPRDAWFTVYLHGLV